MSRIDFVALCGGEAVDQAVGVRQRQRAGRNAGLAQNALDRVRGAGAISQSRVERDVPIGDLGTLGDEPGGDAVDDARHPDRAGAVEDDGAGGQERGRLFEGLDEEAGDLRLDEGGIARGDFDATIES